MFDDGSDLTCMQRGENFVVRVGPILARDGWRGGQWVRYVPPTDTVDLWIVEKSDGVQAAGFLANESEDYSNARVSNYRNYTSYQNRAPSSGARAVTMYTGGGRFFFRQFETISLDVFGVRTGPPAVYVVGETLKVSENGLLCNDPDARLILATGGTSVISVGVCNYVPTVNLPKLGLDLSK